MLNKTTAAPENRRPWRWYRVGAPEEHLSRSVLLRSSTRVGAPEEPGSVLPRSWLLGSRVGNSQERPSPTYQHDCRTGNQRTANQQQESKGKRAAGRRYPRNKHKRRGRANGEAQHQTAGGCAQTTNGEGLTPMKHKKLGGRGKQLQQPAQSKERGKAAERRKPSRGPRHKRSPCGHNGG